MSLLRQVVRLPLKGVGVRRKKLVDGEKAGNILGDQRQSELDRLSKRKNQTLLQRILGTVSDPRFDWGKMSLLLAVRILSIVLSVLVYQAALEAKSMSNVESMIQTLGKVDAILFHQGESDTRQTAEFAEENKRSLRDMLLALEEVTEHTTQRINPRLVAYRRQLVFCSLLLSAQTRNPIQPVLLTSGCSGPRNSLIVRFVVNVRLKS